MRAQTYEVEHIPQVHIACTRNYGCMVCDGGLFICTRCGCLEGSLATECPGYECYTEYGDAIYKGEIDFRNGQWTKEEISINSPRSLNAHRS